MATRYSEAEKELVRRHPEWDVVRLAAELGRPAEGVRDLRKRLERDRRADELGRILVPDATVPKFVNHVVLPTEQAIILNDPHMPLHDAAFMSNVLNVGVAWGVKDLVFGGDLLDVNSYSHWGSNPDQTLEQEFSLAEALFDQITNYFDRIVWIIGNHEARAFKHFEGQVRGRRFLQMITNAPNVEISTYSYVEIRPPSAYKSCGCRKEDEYPWFIFHQKNAATMGGKSARDLSDIWTQCHCVAAHDHLFGATKAKDGRRWAISTGMCADGQRFEYSQKLPCNRPAMTQGAVIIRGQRPHLFQPSDDFSAAAAQFAA